MWEISKEFNFCYGHRVHTQVLNEKFALTTYSKCKHIHGHEGKVLVYIEGDVQADGMIIDFNHLNWLKKFIDDVVDHKSIYDINDPKLHQLVGISLEEADQDTFCNIYAPNTSTIIGQRFTNPIDEIEEGFVFVDFVPTSEKLAEWMFNIVTVILKDFPHAEVSKIEWNETPKSRATYYGHCEYEHTTS